MLIRRAVRAVARDSVFRIARTVWSAAGGEIAGLKFRERVDAAADVETHVDDRGLRDACVSIAAAFIATERVRMEHEDAGVGDLALVRAQALITEAGLLLETLTHVDPHGSAIRRLRGDESDA